MFSQVVVNTHWPVIWGLSRDDWGGGGLTAALTDLNSKNDRSHNEHISGKVLGICPRIVVAKHSHRRLLALFIHLQARERDIRDPVLDPRTAHADYEARRVRSFAAYESIDLSTGRR